MPIVSKYYLHFSIDIYSCWTVVKVKKSTSQSFGLKCSYTNRSEADQGLAERETQEGVDQQQVQARVPGAPSSGRGPAQGRRDKLVTLPSKGLHSGSGPRGTLRENIHAVAAQGEDAVDQGSEKSVSCSMRCRSSVA